MEGRQARAGCSRGRPWRGTAAGGARGISTSAYIVERLRRREDGTHGEGVAEPVEAAVVVREVGPGRVHDVAAVVAGEADVGELVCDALEEVERVLVLEVAQLALGGREGGASSSSKRRGRGRGREARGGEGRREAGRLGVARRDHGGAVGAVGRARRSVLVDRIMRSRRRGLDLDEGHCRARCGVCGLSEVVWVVVGGRCGARGLLSRARRDCGPRRARRRGRGRCSG